MLDPNLLQAVLPRIKAENPKAKAKDIEPLWKASEERAEVLKTMSPAEIKRRRFD